MNNKPDETIPGGCYIVGGRIDPVTKKRMGGTVRDANGKVLFEFPSDQENTGNPNGPVPVPMNPPKPTTSQTSIFASQTPASSMLSSVLNK